MRRADARLREAVGMALARRPLVEPIVIPLGVSRQAARKRFAHNENEGRAAKAAANVAAARAILRDRPARRVEGLDHLRGHPRTQPRVMRGDR